MPIPDEHSRNKGTPLAADYLNLFPGTARAGRASFQNVAMDHLLAYECIAGDAGVGGRWLPAGKEAAKRIKAGDRVRVLVTGDVAEVMGRWTGGAGLLGIADVRYDDGGVLSVVLNRLDLWVPASDAPADAPILYTVGDRVWFHARFHTWKWKRHGRIERVDASQDKPYLITSNDGNPDLWLESTDLHPTSDDPQSPMHNTTPGEPETPQLSESAQREQIARGYIATKAVEDSLWTQDYTEPPEFLLWRLQQTYGWQYQPFPDFDQSGLVGDRWLSHCVARGLDPATGWPPEGSHWEAFKQIYRVDCETIAELQSRGLDKRDRGSIEWTLWWAWCGFTDALKLSRQDGIPVLPRDDTDRLRGLTSRLQGLPDWPDDWHDRYADMILAAQEA